MKPTTHRARAWLLTAAAAAGIAVGAAGIAGAATSGSSGSNGSSSTSSSSGYPAAAPNQGQDPATMTHGPNETLLTGTTADKVKAAALAAVPNATVIRVETDSAGSPYEAHLRKADGTEVTVKVDASFKVTGTESGFGAGPQGSGGQGSGGPGQGAPGQPPAQSGTAPSGSTSGTSA
ncbi:MAG TPA: hypothetical protein VIB48_09140 [Acidimicrobiia bacterium]|jgi:hypothetical protein